MIISSAPLLFQFRRVFSIRNPQNCLSFHRVPTFVRSKDRRRRTPRLPQPLNARVLSFIFSSKSSLRIRVAATTKTYSFSHVFTDVHSILPRPFARRLYPPLRCIKDRRDTRTAFLFPISSLFFTPRRVIYRTALFGQRRRRHRGRKQNERAVHFAAIPPRSGINTRRRRMTRQAL